MENNKYSIGFNAKITPIKPLNKEMTLCKCYVLALGKNRNKSYIEKDTVETALPTIYNIPVVGHIYVDNDGLYHMGGHDMALEKDDEGRYLFKPMTVPYGVVPCQDDIHFEDVMDSSGNINTYQVADIILWTGRYPELKEAIYNDKIYFGQSMEIRIVNTDILADDARYTEIKEFTYSALCLLGKSNDPDFNVEPCFPDARVEPYQFTLSDDFYEGMEEFKRQLSACFAKTDEIGKGGENKMTEETRNAILEAAELTLEDLDFEITDDMTEDEFKCKVDEVKSKKFANEHETVTSADGSQTVDDTYTDNSQGDDVSAPTQESQPQEFSLTYREKFEELGNLIKVFDTKTEDGLMEKVHSLIDYDAIYAYLTEEDWSKCPSSRIYMRIMYVCDEAGKIQLVGDEPQLMICKLLTLEENDKIEKEREDYIQLLKFKEERLALDKQNEYQSVLQEFGDLAHNEDFQAIVEGAMNYESADALRNACYASRGRAVIIAPKQQTAEVRIPITKNNEDAPYGGFFTRYLPTAESQNK